MKQNEHLIKVKINSILIIDSYKYVYFLLFRLILYLLLNGVRGALHSPFLQRGFVLGVDHSSVGHQLQLVVLKRGFTGLKLFLSSKCSTSKFLLIHI